MCFLIQDSLFFKTDATLNPRIPDINKNFSGFLGLSETADSEYLYIFHSGAEFHDCITFG